MIAAGPSEAGDAGARSERGATRTSGLLANQAAHEYPLVHGLVFHETDGSPTFKGWAWQGMSLFRSACHHQFF